MRVRGGAAKKRAEAQTSEERPLSKAVRSAHKPVEVVPISMGRQGKAQTPSLAKLQELLSVGRVNLAELQEEYVAVDSGSSEDVVDQSLAKDLALATGLPWGYTGQIRTRYDDLRKDESKCTDDDYVVIDGEKYLAPARLRRHLVGRKKGAKGSWIFDQHPDIMEIHTIEMCKASVLSSWPDKVGGTEITDDLKEHLAERKAELLKRFADGHFDKYSGLKRSSTDRIITRRFYRKPSDPLPAALMELSGDVVWETVRIETAAVCLYNDATDLHYLDGKQRREVRHTKRDEAQRVPHCSFSRIDGWDEVSLARARQLATEAEESSKKSRRKKGKSETPYYDNSDSSIYRRPPTWDWFLSHPGGKSNLYGDIWEYGKVDPDAKQANASHNWWAAVFQAELDNQKRLAAEEANNHVALEKGYQWHEANSEALEEPSEEVSLDGQDDIPWSYPEVSETVPSHYTDGDISRFAHGALRHDITEMLRENSKFTPTEESIDAWFREGVVEEKPSVSATTDHKPESESVAFVRSDGFTLKTVVPDIPKVRETVAKGVAQAKKPTTSSEAQVAPPFRVQVKIRGDEYVTLNLDEPKSIEKIEGYLTDINNKVGEMALMEDVLEEFREIAMWRQGKLQSGEQYVKFNSLFSTSVLTEPQRGFDARTYRVLTERPAVLGHFQRRKGVVSPGFKAYMDACRRVDEFLKSPRGLLRKAVYLNDAMRRLSIVDQLKLIGENQSDAWFFNKRRQQLQNAKKQSMTVLLKRAKRKRFLLKRHRQRIEQGKLRADSRYRQASFVRGHYHRHIQNPYEASSKRWSRNRQRVEGNLSRKAYRIETVVPREVEALRAMAKTPKSLLNSERGIKPQEVDSYFERAKAWGNSTSIAESVVRVVDKIFKRSTGEPVSTPSDESPDNPVSEASTDHKDARKIPERIEAKQYQAPTVSYPEIPIAPKLLEQAKETSTTSHNGEQYVTLDGGIYVPTRYKRPMGAYIQNIFDKERVA